MHGSFDREVPVAEGLPYVDEHPVTIGASRAVVWDALVRYIDDNFDAATPPRLARMLGAQPPRGFAESERIAQRRLALVGRHRFARYELMFELADAASGTVLRVITYAVFPGLGGRIYRALVVGTRLHVLATRSILAGVRRQAERIAHAA